MTGAHAVRVFKVPIDTDVDGFPLPEGWKPFGVGEVLGMGRARYVEVVCRKWERIEG